MKKKYKLTKEKKSINTPQRTIELRRIKALKDFANVREGDYGGWIEKEDNLSHEATAWVYDDAVVFGNAKVLDDAVVAKKATVYGNAIVCGNAMICGNAFVRDDAMVTGISIVFGDAQVYGKAMVNNSVVHDKAQVYGQAALSSTRLCDDADVFSSDCIMSISAIEGNIATFFRTANRKIRVRWGSFCGSIGEFKQVFADSPEQAKKACRLAKKWIDLDITP